MGRRSSLSLCIRYYYLEEEFVIGNPDLESNSMGWMDVMLNLLGSSSFDPMMPNIYKWNKEVQNITGDIKFF